MTVEQARRALREVLYAAEHEPWMQNRIRRAREGLGEPRLPAREHAAVQAALTRMAHVRVLLDLPDHRLAWLLGNGWRPVPIEPPDDALPTPPWVHDLV